MTDLGSALAGGEEKSRDKEDAGHKTCDFLHVTFHGRGLGISADTSVSFRGFY